MVENIQQILNRHNPFVQTFHHLAQRQDLQNSRLIIREQATNQHQYTLPSVSQVAAIIVGADDAENIRGRDMMIQTKQGELINIQDCVGYYDPLQYPLLLPYGTYGWDVNSRNNNGKKLTCRDYYAYVLQVNKYFFIFSILTFFNNVVLNLKLYHFRSVNMMNQFYSEETVYYNNMLWIIMSKLKRRS